MQPLQTIESILTTLNDKEFKSIEGLIKRQIANNRYQFEQALKEGDINKIENFIDKVSFDEDFLRATRRNVVPHLSSLDYLSTKSIDLKVFTSDIETLNTYYTLFNKVLDLGTERTFLEQVRKEKLELNVSDILFSGLFYRLTTNFQFSAENPFSQYLFLKKFLEKEPIILKKMTDNFCEYSLHKINYQDNSLFIQELLTLGYQDNLFQKAKTLENYSYMKNLIPTKSIYNDAFMLAGLSSYHFPMVKECFESGVSFFKNDDTMTQQEKAQYKNVFSGVFSSKDSFEIQNFIIDNIPNISIGNHIIVKTIIHQLEQKFETDDERNKIRLELIQKVVNRYCELDFDSLLSLKQIINKRESSEAKNFMEKFIHYQEINNKLPSKNIKENKSKI